MVFRKNSVNSVRVVHHAHVFTQDSVRPMSVLPTIMTMMRAVSVRKVLAQVCRVAHPSVPASVHVRADISHVQVKNTVSNHAVVINHVSSARHTVRHVRVDTSSVRAATSHVHSATMAVTSHVSPVRLAMASSVLPTVLPVRADMALLPSRVVTTSSVSRVVPLTVPPLHIIRRSVLPDMIPMLSIA